MESFGALMFTDDVKARQEADGSAETYARMSARGGADELGEDERAFIQSRTSFYMASVSSTGWPYVQHRGGTPGFLKVLGPTALGFADYRGNRQFVSAGNLDGDDRVSLILMDYPRKARLKIMGHARVADLTDDLAKDLAPDPRARAERAVLIDVAAIDWNCPKYIEPRFTEAEIEAMLGPKLQALAAENARLRAELGQD